MAVAKLKPTTIQSHSLNEVADRSSVLVSEVRRLRWYVRLLAATVAFVVASAVISSRGDPETPRGVALDGAVIQVLNGADSDAPLAGPLVDQLRGEGIGLDVLDAANATSERTARTVVLIHGATLEAGLGLARALDLPESRVLVGTPVPLNGDLTVLVGNDRLDAP